VQCTARSISTIKQGIAYGRDRTHAETSAKRFSSPRTDSRTAGARAFADKPVPQDVLRSIFEAARWAPSSNNEQPWAYMVAPRDDKDSFERMLSILVEFNANWPGAPLCWQLPSRN